jgi:7-carboxy-7-deazaguanine synthase
MFWGCNFNCSGFGQEKPEDPSTWELDYENIDVSKYASMEELPVFSRGCDSSYSWSKKFAHLARRGTAAEITTKIREFLRNEHNPEGKFQHPKSGQWTHMAFTGGEPMMSQTAIVDIINQFKEENEVPAYITIETNGTQMPRTPFKNLFSDRDNFTGELFWSVSPKLYLSGEHWDEAIQPEVLAEYANISNQGQLKYVSNGTQRSWDEVERATELYRNAGINWPVWIMPVGADVQGQNKVAAQVSDEAIKRGYNVAARVHTYVYGNRIGK